MGTEGMQVRARSNHIPRYGVLVCGDIREDALAPGFPKIGAPSSRGARNFQHIFVLCPDWYLPQIGTFLRQINREHKLQALLVKTESGPELLPQMLQRANLRFARNILAHSDSIGPRRVLAAWQNNAQAELVANAAVADDRLILVSCEPKTYEVGFEQLPALRNIPAQKRQDFEIARDGSFIWWPENDVHLDLDAILSVVDPARRRRAERLR